MKDHTTGRARGFGFVVFADPAVAERVIKEKHHIDGRMVEAKKAVPREEQSTISRNSGSIQSSPGTRKIFVGGLASTVTESDFKRYFEQFGAITDAVVMYDHNTQRPRGFGFITYDLEDAVEKVLLKTFHELNGKMVEVKRAVPKELSPSPSRTMLGAYPYGLGRTSGFLNGYTQGPYSPGAVGGYGVRMAGRGGFGLFGSGYGMGMGMGMGLNFEPGMTSPNYNRTLSYGRGMSPSPSPYFVGNSNRFSGPIGFDGGSGGGNGGNASFFSSNPRNLWGNNGFNYGSNSTGSSAIGGGIFGNAGVNWGSNLLANQGGRNASSQSGNIGYGGDNSHGLGVGYGRNAVTSEVRTPSYATANGGYEEPFSDFYVGGSGGVGGGNGGSVYGGDSTWRSRNSEQEGSGSFGGYGLGGGSDGGSPDVHTKSPSGYVDGYSVAKRQTNRGIGG
ncbi:hypothetical protein L1987_55458 [Smallanthus sonchifolius]|uniref:Uncharacterized protein n=1 Tax=Smallanthus sonchifolius TaxID=185202 RepID=A0ACB9EAP5_9ASTR|nr:hypothetical protein L1987_55458 [Smallanthus sonchifolius]